MTSEPDDLLSTLDRHRGFLRRTAQGLTDEQARTRSTVSALSVGGVLKHVAAVEARWCDFIVRGPVALQRRAGSAPTEWEDQFRMNDDETVAALLQAYADVAARTDAVVRSLPDLDTTQPLPSAPWFEPGASWSARRVVLHVLAETSQHAGHADIIRESIDGAKTMG